MDSKDFKLVSNKVVFEEFFIDDIEDTITYYFVCKDRELTDLLYGHKDYGRPISGFTVSAEVSLSSDGECPLLMMSPFVIENGDISDIDWEDIYLPLDEAMELVAVGSKYYKASVEANT